MLSTPRVNNSPRVLRCQPPQAKGKPRRYYPGFPTTCSCWSSGSGAAMPEWQLRGPAALARWSGWYCGRNGLVLHGQGTLEQWP